MTERRGDDVDTTAPGTSPGTHGGELPPLPDRPLSHPLRIVILTCGDQAWEVVDALGAVASAQVLAVIRTPEARPKGLRKRLRAVYRYHGLPGLLRIPVNRLQAVWSRRRPDATRGRTVPLLWFRDFHDADCLATLRKLAPDLAIVDGTPVLKPTVFTTPRFGSLNLHCGRLPDYRGAPPAFWELLNGEREVGVTVHRVTTRLDEGPVVAADAVPLEAAPDGDPMEYVRAVWQERLRPRGMTLLSEAVAAIAAGRATVQSQGATAHPTYRRPDRHKVRELRRIVRERRQGR